MSLKTNAQKALLSSISNYCEYYVAPFEVNARWRSENIYLAALNFY